MDVQGGGRRADLIGLLARLVLGVVLIVAGGAQGDLPSRLGEGGSGVSDPSV